jgi:hypothetical protein
VVGFERRFKEKMLFQYQHALLTEEDNTAMLNEGLMKPPIYSRAR